MVLERDRARSQPCQARSKSHLLASNRRSSCLSLPRGWDGSGAALHPRRGPGGAQAPGDPGAGAVAQRPGRGFHPPCVAGRLTEQQTTPALSHARSQLPGGFLGGSLVSSFWAWRQTFPQTSESQKAPRDQRWKMRLAPCVMSPQSPG